MSNDKNTSHSAGHILRSTSVMSLGTLASRVLGFVRDIIFARFFGTAAGAEAFVVAFRLPNLFRDLLGEGAANSSFIPVMTEYKEKRASELADFLNVILAWAFIMLCAVTLLGMIFAPTVVSLVAPGFKGDPAKLKLTADLTRIMFPYLIFIGITAFFSAIQFTYGSFMMPAVGPCLLNVALIVSTLISVWGMKEPVYGLAFGVIAGGVLQLYFQWRPLRHHNVHFAWPKTLANPGAVQVGRLILPRILGSAVYQLNVFIDTICASLASIVGPGGIAAIYYANRLVLLPVGLFGVSLVAACLPLFSSHAVAGRNEDLKRSIRFAQENITFVMMPSMVFLVVLAEPIVRLMFQRGQFDQYSTVQTSTALVFFSLGLVFFGTTKIMAAAFHSLKDTRTPVKAALVSLGVNAVLNLTLMFPMKLAGIALASSIASYVNGAFMFRLLEKRLGKFEPGYGVFVRKAIVAGLAQAAAVAGAWQWLPAVPEMVRLIVVFGLGVVVYFGCTLALGLEQSRKLVASFKGRRDTDTD
jgi:putative peptidoglycan lipid II flippase